MVGAHIRDFTLEELKELDVGGNYHASFAGEQISTLREFLDEFYGQAGLLIDLKNLSCIRALKRK